MNKEEEGEAMRETETASFEVLGVTVALLDKAEKVRFPRESITSLP